MPSGWRYTDEQLLIRYYPVMTIKELKRFFPNRTEDSINAKIKRLKERGKISENKDRDTINRALRQRGKSV